MDDERAYELAERFVNRFETDHLQSVPLEDAHKAMHTLAELALERANVYREDMRASG